MTKTLSPLQQARHDYRPKVPTVLAKGAAVAAVDGPRQEPASDREELRALFPHTYGLPLITFKTGAPPSREPVNVAVILSGGQAPGGHNVIAGLYDGLQSLNPANRLFGFLGGPSGLIQNKYVELTGALVDDYRNTGGFDIIGSGRTKLEKPADFDTVAENCKRLNIRAIVIVGGDDSNTNACVLAEYYAKRQVPIRVVGCPKTIDGDLKNAFIEASFGFDTASRVYSELIGNIARDANSAKKYYHFIKLMGRSASHIALECALQTQPNVCLISEEIAAKQKTLNEIVDDIVRVVVARAAKGKNFGVVLIPEGLIEFVPEMKKLIGELNDLLAQGRSGNDFAKADSEDLLLGLGLSRGSVTAFLSLPNHIRDQLVLDRDDHGNVKVSQIETEKMLIEMVEARLARYKAEGTYKGKFAGLSHFFGYEGRCAPPSNFDADYCTSLGCTAAALVAAGQTGYLASVRHLARPASAWEAGGIPLTSMMNLERRHGATKPVIRKALVDLNGKPFGALAANRERWATEDEFLFPGPIQYFGPAAVCDAPSKTLQLEHS